MHGILGFYPKLLLQQKQKASAQGHSLHEESFKLVGSQIFDPNRLFHVLNQTMNLAITLKSEKFGIHLLNGKQFKLFNKTDNNLDKYAYALHGMVTVCLNIVFTEAWDKEPFYFLQKPNYVV